MASPIIQTQLGIQTTTLGTPTLACQLSGTLTETGETFILVSAEINYDSTSTATPYRRGHVRVRLNTTVELGTIVYEAEDINDWVPITIVRAGSLGAGTNTVDVHFWNESPANEFSIRNIRILVWQTELAGFGEGGSVPSNSPKVTTSQTLTSVCGPVHLDPGTSPMTYLVFWSAIFTAPVASGGGTVVLGGYQSTRQLPDEFTLLRWPNVTVGPFLRRANLATALGGWVLMRTEAGNTWDLHLQVASAVTGKALETTYAAIAAIPVGVDYSPDFTGLSDMAWAEGAIIGQEGAISHPAYAVQDVMLSTSSMYETAASLSFVPHGSGPQLYFASWMLGHSTSQGSLYRIKVGADIVQGPGRVEPNDDGLSRNLSACAFAYSPTPPSPSTASLEIAETGGGTTRLYGACLLALQVTPAITALASATLADQIALLISSVLDRETLQLTDDTAYVAGIGQSVSEDFALTDLVEILGGTPDEQRFQLLDRVMMFRVGDQRIGGTSGLVKVAYGPIQLVELVPPAGSTETIRRYAHRDIYVTHVAGEWAEPTLFKGLLMSAVDTQSAFADDYLSVTVDEGIALQIANTGGEIIRSVEFRGWTARLWAFDPINQECHLAFSGVVTDVSIGFIAEIQASTQPPALWQKTFPLEVIDIEHYPRARDLGYVVTCAWGRINKVPLRLIDENVEKKTWTYLVSRAVDTSTYYSQGFPALACGEWADVRAIYRDGWLVSPTEYTVRQIGLEEFVLPGTVLAPKDIQLTNMTIVQFFQDPEGASLSADIEPSVDLSHQQIRSPVRLIQYLLVSNGQRVDTGSFDRAYLAWARLHESVRMYFEFLATEPRPFSDILGDLMHRIRLTRDKDGKWACWVVTPATQAVLEIGLSDAYGLNNVVSFGALSRTPSGQVGSEYTLEYRPELPFYVPDDGKTTEQTLFMYKRSLPGFTNIPELQPIALPPSSYIWEHVTADMVLQYRAGCVLYGDLRLTATVGLEGRRVKLGDRILVTAPTPYNLDREPFDVIGINRGLTTFDFSLRRYDPRIYEFPRTKDPPSVLDEDPLTPDLSATPPPGLVWFRFDPTRGAPSTPGWTVSGATGTAHLKFRMPTGPKNGTHVVFHWWKLSKAEIIKDLQVAFGTGAWGTEMLQDITGLEVGQAYSFAAYIYASKNHPERQVGPSLQILYDGITVNAVPGDLLPLNLYSVTGNPCTVGGYQTVAGVKEVTVYIKLPDGWIEPPDYRGFKVYRKVGGTSVFAGAEVLKDTAGHPRVIRQTSFGDGDVTYGKTYRYWLSLVDWTGNETEPFGTIGPISVNQTPVSVEVIEITS